MANVPSTRGRGRGSESTSRREDRAAARNLLIQPIADPWQYPRRIPAPRNRRRCRTIRRMAQSQRRRSPPHILVASWRGAVAKVLPSRSSNRMDPRTPVREVDSTIRMSSPNVRSKGLSPIASSSTRYEPNEAPRLLVLRNIRGPEEICRELRRPHRAAAEHQVDEYSSSHQPPGRSTWSDIVRPRSMLRPKSGLVQQLDKASTSAFPAPVGAGSCRRGCLY